MNRPAGMHSDSGDWPVGPKHGYTPDQVVESLTADRSALQDSLRDRLAYLLHDRNAGHGWGCEYCQRNYTCAERYLKQADEVLAMIIPDRNQIDAVLQLHRVGKAYEPPDPIRPGATVNYRRKLRNALLELFGGSA